MKIKTRIEKDSLGTIEIPVDSYWGPQTQRSLQNFPIGKIKVSRRLIEAVATIKFACAVANEKCEKLDAKRSKLIQTVCLEILNGKLNEHFPTFAYQAGSGTQTNMNVNEVIANRANQIAGEKIVHPNDHVNMSQSTNDVYPSAMNITAVDLIIKRLLPTVENLIKEFEKLEEKYRDVIKLGRTHIQDALPMKFGQEISGWTFAIKNGIKMINLALPFMYQLNMGGTAIGTGFDAPNKKGYDKYCVQEINALLRTKKYSITPNKYHGTWSKDNFVFLHGAVKSLATNLYKISQDIRFLSSGPRSGFGEINIPQNEPGSSIMPGKVNPTQCEGMAMICAQVMGHDTTISFLASQGNFELNTFGTVLMENFISSISLFADMIESFSSRCVNQITVNSKEMGSYVNNSLMLVTALTEKLGYEQAAAIAKNAFLKRITLKESALELKLISSKEFDKIVDPSKMC